MIRIREHVSEMAGSRRFCQVGKNMVYPGNGIAGRDGGIDELC
jgi:hypothetical protein